MAKLTPTLGANVPPKLVLSIAQHRRGCRARPRSISRRAGSGVSSTLTRPCMRPPATSRRRVGRHCDASPHYAEGALASCFAPNGPASPPVNTPTFSRSTADHSKAAIYAETAHGLPHSQPSSS
ncbi:hypothetical protein C8R46DRAFT_1213530 [Mycena filopes]|nr:hypothetical protein C8R46DRAFT_1213530 [Mycena filopes]